MSKSSTKISGHFYFDFWAINRGHVKSLKLNKSWPNPDNWILFEDLWFVETPPPMDGYGHVKSQKNWINLDIIEIIDSVLRVMIYGDSPTHGWMYGLVGAWVGQVKCRVPTFLDWQNFMIFPGFKSKFPGIFFITFKVWFPRGFEYKLANLLSFIWTKN